MLSDNFLKCVNGCWWVNEMLWILLRQREKINAINYCYVLHQPMYALWTYNSWMRKLNQTNFCCSNMRNLREMVQNMVFVHIFIMGIPNINPEFPIHLYSWIAQFLKNISLKCFFRRRRKLCIYSLKRYSN